MLRDTLFAWSENGFLGSSSREDERIEIGAGARAEVIGIATATSRV